MYVNYYRKIAHETSMMIQTFGEIFFQVIVLPPVQIAEVACQYRVNQITGRFQLKANDILNYLRKVKTS